MHLLCLKCLANVRAVQPSLLTAWMLACALRHDRPSVPLPYRMPPAIPRLRPIQSHTPDIARISRATDECASSSSRVLAPSTRTRPSKQRAADRPARARRARTRTLAARSWPRQASWPFCAESIKAVMPVLCAASTLACACRQDSVSGAPPHRRPLETATSPWRAYTHTHTRLRRPASRVRQTSAPGPPRTRSHPAGAHGHPSSAQPIG